MLSEKQSLHRYEKQTGTRWSNFLTVGSKNPSEEFSLLYYPLAVSMPACILVAIWSGYTFSWQNSSRHG